MKLPGRNERQALGRRIVDTCLAMNASGINQGKSGNVSARFGDAMLVTPSGVSYDALKPMDVVLLGLDGTPVEDGQLLPSSEWRMHADIYRARPEAQAVVHAHPTFCTALACQRIGIPAFHYMVAVAGGTDIRCSDYATFGTQALSDTMVAALRDRKACILANHGMICFETTLEKALGLAIEVEGLARQYHHARQLGEPVILSDVEMAEVLEKFKTYGKQPGKA
ncbi:MAG: class II aldolase/adducin family protein [Alphaproteobacteria bacterium]|nr:class II aldolase/adducin family protein [Alphaproteobacteria bacterium]